MMAACFCCLTLCMLQQVPVSGHSAYGSRQRHCQTPCPPEVLPVPGHCFHSSLTVWRVQPGALWGALLMLMDCHSALQLT